MNTNNDILVSICSITYNQAPYIRQCLDGFLMQKTNFKFEIIIHDDCSTDGTTEIIREYVEKYPDKIVPVIQTVNQYQNGNKSILASFVYPIAKGKYFALCEGDDYWTDSLKLQKQVDFLEAHPDYSMCFHRAMVLNEMETQKIYLKCNDIEDREYNPNELFLAWKVPTASILVRREVLHVNNKGMNRILNGDIIHVLNSAKIGKIRGMSDVMSVYRIQNAGVTYDKTKREYRTMQYPYHFRFIKDNYSFIDRKIVNRKIAISYLERSKIQKTMKNRIIDYLCAIYFYPNGLLRKLSGHKFGSTSKAYADSLSIYGIKDWGRDIVHT